MIPGLVEGSDDPLNTLRRRLALLYEDGRLWACNIPPALAVLEEEYGKQLGDKAEFWLLLATGYRLAAPYPVYGHPSSSYYGHADSCHDLDDPVYFSLRQDYEDYLIEQLEARPLRSLAIMSEQEAYKYSLAAARLRFSRESRHVLAHLPS